MCVFQVLILHYSQASDSREIPTASVGYALLQVEDITLNGSVVIQEISYELFVVEGPTAQ